MTSKMASLGGMSLEDDVTDRARDRFDAELGVSVKLAFSVLEVSLVLLRHVWLDSSKLLEYLRDVWERNLRGSLQHQIHLLFQLGKSAFLENFQYLFPHAAKASPTRSLPLLCETSGMMLPIWSSAYLQVCRSRAQDEHTGLSGTP